MSRRYVLRPLIVVQIAALALLCSGCVFYRLKGNGPQPREAYAHMLPDAEAQQLERLRQEAFSLPFPLFAKDYPGGGALEDYTCRVGSTFFWPFLAGPFRSIEFWSPEPQAGDKRTFLAAENAWGFLGPVFQTGTRHYYEYPKGHGVAAARQTMILLLIEHDRRVVPAGKGAFLTSQLTDAGVELSDIPYDSMWGLSVGWGLVAWGRKNDRAYFQLLWVPIPLWSRRTES